MHINWSNSILKGAFMLELNNIRKHDLFRSIPLYISSSRVVKNADIESNTLMTTIDVWWSTVGRRCMMINCWKTYIKLNQPVNQLILLSVRQSNVWFSDHSPLPQGDPEVVGFDYCNTPNVIAIRDAKLHAINLSVKVLMKMHIKWPKGVVKNGIMLELKKIR